MLLTWNWPLLLSCVNYELCTGTYHIVLTCTQSGHVLLEFV